MSEMIENPLPSALPPSEEEAAAWSALSREEQIARYRAILSSPEALQVSGATMGEILAIARQLAKVSG